MHDFCFSNNCTACRLFRDNLILFDETKNSRSKAANFHPILFSQSKRINWRSNRDIHQRLLKKEKEKEKRTLGPSSFSFRSTDLHNVRNGSTFLIISSSGGKFLLQVGGEPLALAVALLWKTLLDRSKKRDRRSRVSYWQTWSSAAVTGVDKGRLMSR